MPTKRSSDTQRPKARQATPLPKPKKKGKVSVTEAARAEVPDEGEQPGHGEGGRRKGGKTE